LKRGRRAFLRVPVFGITGGIATGKSSLAAALARLRPEVSLFDSDACARRLTEANPAIREAIRGEFGPEVFDAAGAVRRPVLRDMIFADPGKRAALEAILHPVIRQEWLQLAAGARQAEGTLLVDIPLLFETGAELFFDKVAVVACSPATQRQRLMENRHLSSTLAERIVASQLPLEEKMRRADFVIWNDGGPEPLQAQARLLSGSLFV
jgi:dephospho-CoA kinase